MGVAYRVLSRYQRHFYQSTLTNMVLTVHLVLYVTAKLQDSLLLHRPYMVVDCRGLVMTPVIAF